MSPPSILPFTITLPAVTITIQAPKAKRTQVPVAVGPNNIPTGEFQIQASSGVKNVNNAVLEGVISDDYYTGFNLPYGQYDLAFTVDLASGYVSAEAPGKVGVVYLVAYTGKVDSGNSIPYIITESSPIGAGWVPLECRMTKDAHGKYPLICRAVEYTVPTLINVNGDSYRELGIAKPGDKSNAGDVTMYAVFV